MSHLEQRSIKNIFLDSKENLQIVVNWTFPVHEITTDLLNLIIRFRFQSLKYYLISYFNKTIFKNDFKDNYNTTTSNFSIGYI